MFGQGKSIAYAARWGTAVVMAAAVVACQASVPAPTLGPRPSNEHGSTPTAAQASQTVTPAVTLSVGPGPEGPVQQAAVASVSDGDTIHVLIDGVNYRVRYIGMNAPESVDPDKPVEPGGLEASAANKALVSGQTVWLERDTSDTDQFGRLLRYVWLHPAAGWVMVDRQLVLEGWAEARDYRPDTKYHDTLFEAMAQAQAAHVGLWGPPFTSP